MTIPKNATVGSLSWLFDPATDAPVGLRRGGDSKQWDLADLLSGVAGDVATDTIFDAAGDLVVGTGANAAARLPMGTALQVLRVNAAGTGLEYATPTSGSGIGYLGAYATVAALAAANPNAPLGAWANVGASEAAYVPYNLKTLPGSVDANWQATAGTITSGSVFTVEIVPGTAPCFFAVSAPIGDILTVTIGGATQPRVIGSGIANWTFFRIADPNGAALPSSVTVQRTTGSGTTGLFALNGGPSIEMFPGTVDSYADLLAIYPNLGTDIGNLPPGWRVYLRNEDAFVRVSGDSLLWIADSPIYAAKPTSPAGTAILMFGPAGHSTWGSAGAPARKVVRTARFLLPNSPTIKGIRLWLQTAGTVGANTGAVDFRLYEVDPNGSPLRNRAPLYVWSYSIDGLGTGGHGLGTGTRGLLDLTTGAGATKYVALPGGNRRFPTEFIAVYIHDFGTAPVTSTVSLTSLDKGRHPPATMTALNYDVSAGYLWDESGTGWSSGELAVFPTTAEMIQSGVAVPAFGFELA